MTSVPPKISTARAKRANAKDGRTQAGSVTLRLSPKQRLSHIPLPDFAGPSQYETEFRFHVGDNYNRKTSFTYFFGIKNS